MKMLMLIVTTGLEFDDRLRKEAIGATATGAAVTILALESANRASDQIVYDRAHARTLYLSTRKWFPGGSGLLLKTFELYGRMLLWILANRPETVWVHDLELAGLVPVLALLRRAGWFRRLIWDQHELPSDNILARPFAMGFILWAMNRCDQIVMANASRRDYILRRYKNRLKTNIEVLENYPDSTFLDAEPTDLPADAKVWLEGSPYILAQGGAAPGRHFNELSDALMKQSKVKLIVIGGCQKTILEGLTSRHGEAWKARIHFTGFIPQMAILPFIDHAQASVVLYQRTPLNCWLCAPNRLFQAVGRGLPVLVGENPPFAEVDGSWGCGIALRDGPPNSTSIWNGLERLLQNREAFATRAREARSHIQWEHQAPIIRRILA